VIIFVKFFDKNPPLGGEGVKIEWIMGFTTSSWILTISIY